MSPFTDLFGKWYQFNQSLNILGNMLIRFLELDEKIDIKLMSVH